MRPFYFYRYAVAVFAMSLTTHVLDTARGRPGGGITLTLYAVSADGERTPIKTAVTNADGRTDTPLGELRAGGTRRHGGLRPPQPLDQVALRFGIAEPDQHYHIPLLVSPWSYSTYRGS